MLNQLKQVTMETKELNLCELLKGCEGIELWCDIFGKCKLLTTEGDNSPHEIEIELIDEGADKDVIECFTSDGKFYAGYPNGKCMLWPSETNRDWSTFKKPIKIKPYDWVFALTYTDKVFIVCEYGDLDLSKKWKYIIPYEKMDITLNGDQLKELSIV